LNDEDEVERVLLGSDISQFLRDLIAELQNVYGDESIDPMKRTGWHNGPDTIEVMGCQAADLTCVKQISSVPTVAAAAPDLPTVDGFLMCNVPPSYRRVLTCDAKLLTPLRTATTTALVLRNLQDVRSTESLGIIGSGVEGIAHGVVLSCLVPSVQSVTFVDQHATRAERASERVNDVLARYGQREISCRSAGSDLASACAADAIITATYGTNPVLSNRDISGADRPVVIAAIGADLKDKRELDYAIYPLAKFIADDVDQCFREGELQHARSMLGRGRRGKDSRIVSVGDLLKNSKRFVARSEGIIVYDSTGYAGQDLAVARVLLRHLEKSRAAHSGKKPWSIHDYPETPYHGHILRPS
jgi:ornithine cyclodeaminase/alanine dehydrogenase-like protein (mu-crystallin family)